MGCTASKLSNEDSVRQCKSRRHLIKSAVIARHHLAAAHSDYLHSLKSTGSALATFASGEPLHVSEHSPAILLPSTKPPATIFRSPISTPKPTHTGPTGQTTQTSQTGQTGSLNNTHRRPKLPHILSESSEASYSPNPKKFTYNAQGNYNSTPSQASSVWNWENFYPPSPPDSEYFNNRKPNSDSDDDTSSIYSNYTRSTQRTNRHNPEVKMKNIRRMDSEDDTSSIYSNYTQRTNPHNPEVKTFRRPDQSSETESERVRGYGGRNLNNMEVKTFRRPDFNGRRQNSDIPASETESERDGDAPELYSTSSSTSGDYDEENDRETRSEDESRSNFGSSVYGESVARAPPSAAKSKVSGGDSGEYDGDSDMRMVIRHRDLAEIVAAIKEWFDKAAEAGGQVAEMMETGGDQLDRSFRKLKKKVYHSSGVLSNLSSSWTSKPPLAIKYRFEPDSIGEPGGPGGSKSLCSTLDRLMAWEMKLYQEVKAREGVKIEHERKLSTLQSQEYKGEEESKLNKTKASIKKLQSLIVVTSQAVSTTSTAIVGLRDAELVPQLIELCHGFMYMWRSMHQCHEVQNHVVQQVRGLVTRSTKGESTSDLHRQATRDLEAAVSAWHSSFCRLIKFQRDFIKSLQGWFKLTLLPIDDANINGSQPSDVYIVFDEWKLALDRLPDTVASEAIKSFINVVHSISLKQTEEMKLKKRTESASKELEKKASSLRSIEKKYYHSYSMVGIGLPASGKDDGYGLDARDPLSEKKTELVACQRRVEDEMLRHSKAVEVTRSMTLNNIQTGLPGVFQAMTSFSGLIMEALEVVCNKSYAVK